VVEPLEERDLVKDITLSPKLSELPAGAVRSKAMNKR